MRPLSGSECPCAGELDARGAVELLDPVHWRWGPDERHPVANEVTETAVLETPPGTSFPLIVNDDGGQQWREYLIEQSFLHGGGDAVLSGIGLRSPIDRAYRFPGATQQAAELVEDHELSNALHA